MDILVILLGEFEAQIDMSASVLIQVLVPWQSAYYVGTHPHALLHELESTVIADNRLLRKVNRFDGDNSVPLFAQCNDALKRT